MVDVRASTRVQTLHLFEHTCKEKGVRASAGVRAGVRECGCAGVRACVEGGTGQHVLAQQQHTGSHTNGCAPTHC